MSPAFIILVVIFLGIIVSAALVPYRYEQDYTAPAQADKENPRDESW
jgi:hypothetical protein